MPRPEAEQLFEGLPLGHLCIDLRVLWLLGDRASCRAFSEAAISLEGLGTVLHAAYGVIDVSELALEFPDRPAPSGGGLYPLELYM